MHDTTRIEALIAASSLGTPEAVAARATVPDAVVRAIVARSRRAADPGMCRICHGEPAVTERDGARLCGDCAQAHDHYDSLTADELALDLLAQQIHVTETQIAGTS